MRRFGGKVDDESSQETLEDTKKQTAARLAAEMLVLAQELSGKAQELIDEVEESREERKKNA